MKEKINLPEGSIYLKPGEGRQYEMGRLNAKFIADEDETIEKYCVSEWWLDPNTEGPGAHKHEENDEIFYVLEGTMSFLVGDSWVKAEKGSYIIIPPKTMHDFANNTDKKAGVLNVFIPGGFERNMPEIAKWFKENR